MLLTEPEADAADVSPALFELGNVWSKTGEATRFEFFLEFWGLVGHNDVFTSTDKIVSKALGAFFEVDFDFIDVGDGFEFFDGFFVESIWAVSDSAVVYDGDSEIEIIPETVGVISVRIDMWSAICVKLGFGVDLDEFEAESFGGKLLGFWIGTITAAADQIFSTAK